MWFMDTLLGLLGLGDSMDAPSSSILKLQYICVPLLSIRREGHITVTANQRRHDIGYHITYRDRKRLWVLDGRKLIPLC